MLQIRAWRLSYIRIGSSHWPFSCHGQATCSTLSSKWHRPQWCDWIDRNPGCHGHRISGMSCSPLPTGDGALKGDTGDTDGSMVWWFNQPSIKHYWTVGPCWGHPPQSWRSGPNTLQWCWWRCMGWRQHQTRSPSRRILTKAKWASNRWIWGTQSDKAESPPQSS